MRIRYFVCGLIALFTNALCLADNGIEDGTADIRVFIRGSSVKVLLNYDQFVSTQLATNNPKLTKKNVESSIRMTIDRWTQVTGLNLRITYGGTTTKTNPGPGEILIGAAIDAAVPGFRAGSYRNNTDDSTNGSCRTDFYRRTDSSSEYNWHAFNYNAYPSGAVFFHSTLMHEFGHCLGLQHNMNTDGPGQIATLRTVMTPPVNVHSGYGPYIEDVQDIIDLYGTRSSAKVDVLVSKDNGLSWATVNPNLQNLDTAQAIIANRDNDRMMLFLTSLDHRPAYVLGSNGGDTWNSVITFAREHSMYGTSGSGFAGKYMMAWVDPEQNYIKIVFTNDAASSWSSRSPSGFRAAGTPAIRQISGSTWILSYAYLDQDPYKNENGRILSSISTDDGKTWSTPVELSAGKRTLGGVTVASKDKNDIRIGFVQTDDGDDRWTTTINSISAHLDANNALVYDGAGSSTANASTSDASSTCTSRVFVLGYRETNASITSCNRDFDSVSWQQCASVATGYRGIPPTVVGKSNSNWAYLFKELSPPVIK